MTRDDIIKMAREAGFRTYTFEASTLSDLPERLTKFAALVAAAERKRIESRPWGAGKEWIARAIEAEREACAKMAEAFHQHGYDFTGDLELHEAIRARGEQ